MITNLEALASECEPYSPSQATLKKSLADVGLSDSEEYNSANNQKICLAAANSLSRFIALNSESEGGFALGHDPSKIVDRIKILAQNAGVDASKFIAVPTINRINPW